MELVYKNEKLKRLCEDANYNKVLIKSFGVEVAKKLPRRIMELKAFECLNDVPVCLPFRRHKLTGNLKGNFAINITDQFRLIFRPQNNNIVIEDLRHIKYIEIMEVSKHYE